MNEKYIKKINDKYIVHREFGGKDYEFASCSSLFEAIERRDKIDNDGWPIKVNKQKIISTERKDNTNKIKKK